MAVQNVTARDTDTLLVRNAMAIRKSGAPVVVAPANLSKPANAAVKR